MNAIIITLISLCSFNLYASKSYIVKLKKNFSPENKSISNLGTFRKLRLKGLSYYEFKPSKQLKSLSTLEGVSFIQENTKLFHPGILQEEKESFL